MHTVFLASVAIIAAVPAVAQEAVVTENMADDIIITATKRSQALSDVPIAVSAVTAETLRNSGASDIRQLQQVSPSLLVSSTTSEAGAGVARIRGIGTVGDNPGLEASVAVFIDGVYRSRSGSGLTELGEIERIEVLRGPQGTLFGRNASAGLINVVTAKPKFESGGSAELSYGNFNYWRLGASITGPLIENKLAYRLDGIYTKRDGLFEDVLSDRSINNRDRYLIRGQLLFTPNDDIDIRIVGDYAKRDEECCVSGFLPFRMASRDAGGNLVFGPSPIAALIRSLGGVISDDTYARESALTPGRSFQSDVTDWGLSGEVNWDFGAATLTSITAYRDWKLVSGQDADFMSLDVLERAGQQRSFKTFSQELRLQGTAFDDRLDWLVGTYYSNEDLNLQDTLRYGKDYMRYANALVRLSLPTFPGYEAIAAALGRPTDTLNGRGMELDTFDHNSRNYAFFTHNVVELVPDRLSLTLGARYTNERKTLDMSLNGNNTLCAAIAASPYAALATLPCVINQIDNFTDSSRKAEDQWTGTAVLAFKVTPDLMTYGSYSKGYKAGGFNLDRSALNPTAVTMDALKFEPETVNSFEIGAKLDLRQFRLNVAAFRSVFDQFQLNTFNGTNFIVENVQSCRDDLNGADGDFLGNAAQTGACDADRVTGGVTSTGVELEATAFPAPALAVNMGLTVAKSKYRDNLVGIGGRPMPPTLFNLPGQQMSNASEYVVTGAVTWTPDLGNNLGGLFYVDYRYQSAINTGSDLFPEKAQPGFLVVNARVGLNGNERKWSVEAWVQNLLDEEYSQVGFNAPLQGAGTWAQTARGGPNATTLFGNFLGEPRTFGVTVRTRF